MRGFDRHCDRAVGDGTEAIGPLCAPGAPRYSTLGSYWADRHVTLRLELVLRTRRLTFLLIAVLAQRFALPTQRPDLPETFAC